MKQINRLAVTAAVAVALALPAAPAQAIGFLPFLLGTAARQGASSAARQRASSAGRRTAITERQAVRSSVGQKAIGALVIGGVVFSSKAEAELQQAIDQEQESVRFPLCDGRAISFSEPCHGTRGKNVRVEIEE